MTTFIGTAVADVANVQTGALTGFTGGTIGDLQDATGDSITGADGADTVVAGSGNDTIKGGLGTDSIDGGNGDDRIQVAGSEFVGAEFMSGGAGSGDILEASGTINFDNGFATLSGIETLVVSGTNPHLTFSAAQFQNFTSMQGAVTPGTVDVIINVSTSFSLAPVTITGWNNQHYVWLLGSAAANAITTNDVSYNRVTGHGGADTLMGGANTDLFFYYAAGDVEAGEVIDGGGGNRNDLQLAGPAGTIYDFTVATITNIQTIDFSLGGGGTAYMPASLFIGFAGGIAQIFGSYGADTIITTGSQVNMGAAQFYFDPPGFIGNWDPSIDRIIINGTSGQDTLIGSDTNDSIYGLEGDDRINPSSGADSVDGGAGFDIISYGILGLAGLTINLTTGVHTGEAANDTLVGFEGISGTSNADDLTGDGIANRLEGQNGNDTLTGLDGADTLVGGYNDDSMLGGDGFDVFEATQELDGVDFMRGGAGFDIVSYAAITGNNDINVTLNGNTIVTVGIGGGHNDSIVGIEGVVGAAGEDSLTGDQFANFFRGLAANDSLYGVGGNDTLEGSEGDDLLDGGANDDLLIADGVVAWTSNAMSVQRLYLACFRRPADDGGQINWTTALDTGTSLALVATGFVASQEFFNLYGSPTNEQYVTLLYQNVLNRVPDTAGFNNWMAQLNSGTSREQVLLGFSESAEFQIATNITNFAGEVYRLYDSAFNRAADVGGFTGWVDARTSGMALSTMVDGFMASAEFTNLYGSLSNSDFVNQLYLNALNRPADPGGLAFWVGQLDTAAQTRAQVLIGFSEGQEHINLMAVGLNGFMDTAAGFHRDVLAGGSGVNSLTGGRGADSFIFNTADNATATVYGFEVFDTLRFEGFGFANPAAALAAMSQQGANVVFASQGDTITFHNTQLATLQALQASDWVFV